MRSLNARQEAAIELMLGGKTKREVAEALGITRQAIEGWTKRNPLFAAELSRLRADRRVAVGATLDAVALDAVRVLEEVMKDKGQKGAVRVRAAAELLSRAGITAALAIELRTSGEAETAMPEDVRESLEGRLVELLAG